jgi:D-sedoheptulose 7-phosphate isomerase
MGQIPKDPFKSPLESLRAFVRDNVRTTQEFFRTNEAAVVRTARHISAALLAGNKLLICGNGGSAADSEHWAAEIVGTFSQFRPGFPAIALSSDSAIVTAVGNDLGFDQVFARQVQAYGLPGDVLIVLTTSGNSKNILSAVAEAKRRKMRVVAMAGKGGGALRSMVPEVLLVHSQSTPRIQEVQKLMIHAVCALVEERLFADLRASGRPSARLKRPAGRNGIIGSHGGQRKSRV